MTSALLRLYRFLFLRRAFYRWHKGLFLLGLSGIGILNYPEKRLVPEERFLRGLFRGRTAATVLDIGAHQGSYAAQVMAAIPQAVVYAFEPHPKTFAHLVAAAERSGFHALNVACGDCTGSVTLYDYSAAEESGSEHASLYPEVITQAGRRETVYWNVPVITVDEFLQQRQIAQVDLLKIDTEGNELQVLQGASQALSQKKIDVIQFEFNDMNVASRVFFQDFYRVLPDYHFYRMLPDGLIPLGEYAPLLCEIFSCQNIVAIRGGVLTPHLARS